MFFNKTSVEKILAVKVTNINVNVDLIPANAAKEGLRPYFLDIMEQFKLYLVPQSESSVITDEEMRKLQIQTLGIVVERVQELLWKFYLIR